MRRIGLLALPVILSLAQGASARGEGPVAATPAAHQAAASSDVQAPWPQIGASSDSATPPAPPMPGESPAGGSFAGQGGAPPPPTLGAAGFRVLGATAVVAVLLTLTLLLLRWLFRQAGRSASPSRRRVGPAGRAGWLSLWMPAAASAADRLEILERSYVGAKESVCIVRAGTERFLIGVTTSRICFLGRLEPAREVAEETEEPGGADFVRALGTAVPRPSPTDGSFHALLARSRERLTRLGVDAVHAGARRE
jgi:hypothetical protein